MATAFTLTHATRPPFSFTCPSSWTPPAPRPVCGVGEVRAREETATARLLPPLSTHPPLSSLFPFFFSPGSTVPRSGRPPGTSASCTFRSTFGRTVTGRERARGDCESRCGAKETTTQKTSSTPRLVSLSLLFLSLYLFLGRLQVFAPERVHAVPEAPLHERVVHAEAVGGGAGREACGVRTERARGRSRLAARTGAPPAPSFLPVPLPVPDLHLVDLGHQLGLVGGGHVARGGVHGAWGWGWWWGGGRQERERKTTPMRSSRGAVRT